MRRQRLKKQLFTQSMSVEGVSGAIYPHWSGDNGSLFDFQPFDQFSIT